MRFLRLDFRDDLSSLDFHPLVTVVPPLPAAQRRQLFEAVRRLSSRSTVGLRGLVEHEGLLVELDATSGDPLAPVITSAGVLVYVDGVEVQSDEVGLQAEIDQWERQAAIDAVAVEEIRSDLDLAAKAKIEELRNGGKPNAGGVEVAETPRKLKVLAIRRAYDAVMGEDREVPRCDPEIADLLDRWDAYRRRRVENREHVEAIAAQIRQAEAEIQARAQELEAAKQAARPIMLTPEQEARLESLTDLFNRSSRLGKWKSKLSDEEEAERLELLGIVGTSSWTEYSVYRMAPTVTPERRAAVEEAKAALAAAEAKLAQARSTQAADRVLVELRTELEGIKADGQPYLGVLVPSDIGAALRAHVEQVENPRWVAALNNLRDALSSNDLQPPYGFEPNEILGWTDSWLRAQESFETGTDGTDDDVDDAARAEAERAAEVAATLQTFARHTRALSRIDRAERAAARSALRVRELKNQLRTRSSAPAATTAAEVVALVAPVAEQVLQDVGGSVPIAVIGDLVGLPDGEVEGLMRALEEVAQQVQVIIVTDHQGITSWAERAGLERASVASRTGVLI